MAGDTRLARLETVAQDHDGQAQAPALALGGRRIVVGEAHGDVGRGAVSSAEWASIRACSRRGVALALSAALTITWSRICASPENTKL
ncbi:hypothetical protein [Pseudomarimonas salicorniae]|uniref:Uncharacterized protein n=1 Tax=Pseudomarimonas salicorniae TaxID=2933270 RepID=A0ABT0GFW6_9GAMM|nr:hypothetical protein [Lysobacter sp. CAU 1642]MCK7593435.1 hypothetical protein [Lysobacter sp. CAU 1642]